jgi:hypothetical protein
MDLALKTGYYVGYRIIFFPLNATDTINDVYKNQTVAITASGFTPDDGGGGANVNTLRMTYARINNTNVLKSGDTGEVGYMLIPPNTQNFGNLPISASAKRSIKYHRSKPNQILLPLNLANLFPHQDKILVGFKWSVKLYFAKDTATLFHTHPTNKYAYRIKTNSPVLRVATPNFKDKEKAIMGRRYLDTKVNIPYGGVSVFSRTYDSKGGSVDLQPFRRTEKPLSIFVCFHNEDTVANGGRKYEDQNFNSLVFDNCMLETIRTRIESTNYPTEDIRCNFIEPVNEKSDAIKFERAWTYFRDAYSRTDDYSGGIIITKDQWKNLYPIFYFDVESANVDGLYNNKTDLNISIIYNLKNFIRHTIYVVTVTKREMELDMVGGVGKIQKLF